MSAHIEPKKQDLIELNYEESDIGKILKQDLVISERDSGRQDQKKEQRPERKRIVILNSTGRDQMKKGRPNSSSEDGSKNGDNDDDEEEGSHMVVGEAALGDPMGHAAYDKEYLDRETF